MDLKSMLLPEKVVTFDFPGCDGLTFDLAFLSKESNQNLYKKCQKTKFDKSHQQIEVFDDDLFLELYVGSIIKGWKGFKLKYLKELVLSEVPLGADDQLLTYTDENALDLMKSSTTFDTWVSGVISDLGNFTSDSTISKLKNSSPTLKSLDQV